ncbi:MAG: hypothetical protein ACKO9X_08825 [Dolichospermum sp.]
MEMSKLTCPLGLVNNCEPSIAKGRGCRNYDKCSDVTSVTIGLPYAYNERTKGLYVVTTHPRVSKWTNFRVWAYDYDRYHPLVLDTHLELETHFAVAEDIPNFDWDIYNKLNPQDADWDIPF